VEKKCRGGRESRERAEESVRGEGILILWEGVKSSRGKVFTINGTGEKRVFTFEQIKGEKNDFIHIFRGGESVREGIDSSSAAEGEGAFFLNPKKRCNFPTA